MVHPYQPDYPLPTSPSVTRIMKANKRTNTKPEIIIRSCLHKLGYRFRKDLLIRCNSRNCRPDIVFSKIKIVVFIDGCFWHLCPVHGHIPKSNPHYWDNKLKRNCERDQLDNLALEKEGWQVIRIWEHVPVDEAARIIIEEIEKKTKKPV